MTTEPPKNLDELFDWLRKRDLVDGKHGIIVCSIQRKSGEDNLTVETAFLSISDRDSTIAISELAGAVHERNPGFKELKLISVLAASIAKVGEVERETFR